MYPKFFLLGTTLNLQSFIFFTDNKLFLTLYFTLVN